MAKYIPLQFTKALLIGNALALFICMAINMQQTIAMQENSFNNTTYSEEIIDLSSDTRLDGMSIPYDITTQLDFHDCTNYYHQTHYTNNEIVAIRHSPNPINIYGINTVEKKILYSHDFRKYNAQKYLKNHENSIAKIGEIFFTSNRYLPLTFTLQQPDPVKGGVVYTDQNKKHYTLHYYRDYLGPRVNHTIRDFDFRKEENLKTPEFLHLKKIDGFVRKSQDGSYVDFEHNIYQDTTSKKLYKILESQLILIKNDDIKPFIIKHTITNLFNSKKQPWAKIIAQKKSLDLYITFE